jgi:hypothetical protein
MPGLLSRLLRGEEPSVKDLEAVDSTGNVEDFIVPLQHMVNIILDIYSQSGRDVTDWTLKDLTRIAECAGRFERLNGGAKK